MSMLSPMKATKQMMILQKLAVKRNHKKTKVNLVNMWKIITEAVEDTG